MTARAARRARPVAAAAPAARASASTVAQSLKSASSVIAPLTAITAVLLYVGWIRTRAFYSYFGVSPSILNFGPQDYILRSADVGIGAVVLLACAAATLLLLDALLAYLLQRVDGRPIQRWARWSLAVAGGGLALSALFSATAAASVAALPPITSAGLIALGTTLFLRFGAGTATRAGLLGSATTGFGLVVLSLAGLWAANAYAQQIGTGGAAVIDHDPSGLAVVTILSKDPLDLPGTNITTARLPTQDGSWSYRYTGAELLAYANDRWILISSPPTAGYRSTVTILHDSDAIRVQSSTPDNAQ
jgi:hypothetical protein